MQNDDNVTAEELSKLLGMHTFTANVSLAQGENLYIGAFDETEKKKAFVRFTANENLTDARIVLGYWKTDNSPEARYGYITPAGDSGTGRFTVPQPFTGVTISTPAYKVGGAFAFLRFERSDMYLGYWITSD